MLHLPKWLTPIQICMALIFHPYSHIGVLYSAKDNSNMLNIAEHVNRNDTIETSINIILLLCAFANESADKYSLLYSGALGCGGDTDMLYIRREVKHEHKAGGRTSLF